MLRRLHLGERGTVGWVAHLSFFGVDFGGRKPRVQRGRLIRSQWFPPSFSGRVLPVGSPLRIAAVVVAGVSRELLLLRIILLRWCLLPRRPLFLQQGTRRRQRRPSCTILVSVRGRKAVAIIPRQQQQQQHTDRIARRRRPKTRPEVEWI